MKIGVIYPQTELGGDPLAAERFAQAVDDFGYSHILAFDHVLGADHAGREPALEGPYGLDDPFHDPFVLFAYLAGRHSRLEFATGVLVLPQRQTALVAKQAADLSILSRGRLRLGVGVGWNHVEYAALGVDFQARGSRADEQIGLLRRYWTEPVVTFEGRFDRVERASINPRPAVPVPVWIGGYSEAALRRAARYGDGFIYGGGIESLTCMWNRTKVLLAEHGRSSDEFGADYMARSTRGPGEVAERVDQWRTMKGTHASVLTMLLGHKCVDDHIDYMEKVAQELGLKPRPTLESAASHP